MNADRVVMTRSGAFPRLLDREEPSVPETRDAATPTNGSLAVAITTRDSIRSIERAIESVRAIAHRVVVVDSGSTDGTVERCEALGATVLHREWPGHVEQKRFAIGQCEDARWVLLLDSDEALEPGLREAVRQAVAADDPAVQGWWVRRKIWFLDGWLHHAYQPEWRLRLVRPRHVKVVGTPPHDRLEVEGKTRRLRGVLRHDSWADVPDLATRQICYARLAAEHDYRGGSLFNLLVSPTAAMLKQLLVKRAILDGRRGLIVAGMTFNATMLKHACLAARRLRTRAEDDRR